MFSIHIGRLSLVRSFAKSELQTWFRCKGAVLYTGHCLATVAVVSAASWDFQSLKSPLSLNALVTNTLALGSQ
jgi:hypothetical protein